MSFVSSGEDETHFRLFETQRLKLFGYLNQKSYWPGRTMLYTI